VQSLVEELGLAAPSHLRPHLASIVPLLLVSLEQGAEGQEQGKEGKEGGSGGRDGKGDGGVKRTLRLLQTLQVSVTL
jgi:hypothetical protein